MMIGIAGPEPEGLAGRIRSKGHTVVWIARELGRLPEVDLVLLFGGDPAYEELLWRRRQDCARPPKIVRATPSGSRAQAGGPSAAVPAG